MRANFEILKMFAIIIKHPTERFITEIKLYLYASNALIIMPSELLQCVSLLYFYFLSVNNRDLAFFQTKLSVGKLTSVTIFE